MNIIMMEKKKNKGTDKAQLTKKKGYVNLMVDFVKK
jgi:hypothetical protein